MEKTHPTRQENMAPNNVKRESCQTNVPGYAYLSSVSLSTYFLESDVEKCSQARHGSVS